MGDLYSNFADVYDDCGVDKYALSFGEAMLNYLEMMHPDETFKRNLDICCGTGTLCNFFKGKGLETKGVDISKEMLDVASSKYPDIEFVVCDATTYRDEETYDFVSCTDDAVSHLTDPDDVKKVFETVNTLLRDGGMFIFDINFFDSFVFEKFDKSLDDFRRLSYDISRDGKIVNFDVEYYENDELLWRNSVSERDYSIEEMTVMLNDAGFILEACSQHFLGEKRAEKWKIVARKLE